MEPRFLRQLAEIIDLGSVTLAAKSLNVSQPTLSRNIKSLEALVKAPLLNRGPLGVTPTAVGELLAKEGRAIRDSLRQVEVNLVNWHGSLQGRLHIGSGVMLAHSVMPIFLDQVAASGWNAGLRIEVQSADRLIDRVRSGILDAAVVEFGPLLSREGLIETPLLDDPRAFYVGATHPLADLTSVSTAQIVASRHITVGSFLDDRFAPVSKATMQSGNGPYIELSGDLGMALHLLSTGRFIAMLPQFVMANLCDDRTFKRLAYRGRLPSKQLSIWHRSELAGHALVGEFVTRFRRFVQKINVDTESGPCSRKQVGGRSRVTNK